MSTVSGLDIANNVEREWRDRLNSAVLEERVACAKIAQEAWQVFYDTKRAHERNSLEPFNMERFGFNIQLIQQSLQIADKIRSRSNL